MRLLHPRTIKILASHPEFPKTHIANAWSEVFKYLDGNKTNPKIFIDDDRYLGSYMAVLEYYGHKIGCEFNSSNISSSDKLSQEFKDGFSSYSGLYLCSPSEQRSALRELLAIEDRYFDDDHLFSDACSLYYKGINIFPDIFGNKWRKYVLVESLKEVRRKIDKTIMTLF